MSSRARSACLGALFVGCGVLLAIGCSDDSGSKKVRAVGGEAGEAGESSAGAGTGGTGGAPTAGTGGLGEAGQGPAQGGSAVVGAAGAPAVAESGAPSVAEGGAAGDTSTAGTGPLACVSSGSVTNLSIPEQAQVTVCRGALVTTNFNADSSDATFQCCASLGLGSMASSIVVAGLGNGDGGQLAFTVPDDAVSGAQSASVTCSGSAGPASLDVNISDASLPVVTGLENSTIDSNSDLVIDGTNLSGVTSVTAVSTTDASTTACQINPDSSNDSVVTCNFGGEIPSNADYYLVVSASNCGDAVVQPTFTVIPST
jgi:hypothetical protein